MTDNALRALRKSKGFSQTALAARCQTHQSLISRAELQMHPPSFDLQIKIAFAMGLSLHELQTACSWPVTVIPGMGQTAHA